MDIVDSYAHCGLRKYKPYADLDRVMRASGVTRAVLAQHRGEYDHSYIEGIVKAEPERFAGVFLVDLESPAAMDDVTRWASRKTFRGIRLPVESLRTHRNLWVWAAQLRLHFVVDGGLTASAPLLAEFAKQLPETAVQITHMAGPRNPTEMIPVLRLSERSNIRIQVSGMHMFGQPPYDGLVPWIEILHRTFGENRLLYASNFPVMKDDSLYREEIDLLRSGKLGIPESAIGKVMHDNAARLWFRA